MASSMVMAVVGFIGDEVYAAALLGLIVGNIGRLPLIPVAVIVLWNDASDMNHVVAEAR